MTPDKWDQVERLLHAAGPLEPEERAAFLASISDPELRSEVISLLAADRDGPDLSAVILGAAETVLKEPPVGQIISHFELIRLLGRGGMGEVYLAKDLNLGRQVALKLLPRGFAGSSERVRRFEREARAAAALNHPNLVTVHEIGEWQGQPFIAMEHVDGETLEERLRRGAMPQGEAVNTAAQIADGLAAAHQAGIIHRDLKPANAMLRPDGSVKVLDFGLARLIQVGAGDETQTQTAIGRVMGTPAYMAPEQREGREADARSDIYAFGLVLYELLTGRRPESGRAVLKDPALEAIVAKCLRAVPGERWESAAELARQLRRAQAGRPRWRPVAVAAGAAILGIGFWFWQQPHARALTDQDVLVLADFANATGDAAFDGALRQALAMHLEQSPFLRILEDATTRQDLRLMGREAGGPITNQNAHDVCVREGAAATIAGSIAALGKSYVVTLHAVTCQSGATLARAQAEAENQEHVLQALGTAALSLRTKLGESLASVEKTARPLDQYTTSSLEAHRIYALGHAELSQGRPTVAISFLQRATELDPQFAMAHFYLAVALTGSGEIGRGNESMKRAFALVDRVSEYERQIILGRYYWRVSGELDRAVDSFELTKRSYPRWFGAPNELGGLYATMGEFEKSLEELLLAQRLSPRIEISYRNLASAYLRLDRLQDAKQILAKARTLQLETSRIHQRTLEIALVENDDATAAKEIAWFKGKPTEFDALAVRANHADARGHRREAAELYEQAAAAARRRGVTEAVEQLEESNALAQALTGECKAVTELGRPALALALCGEPERAEKLMAEKSRKSPNDTLLHAVHIPVARGAVQLKRKQPAQTIELLMPAVPFERAYPQAVYLRGLAYQESANKVAADAEFRKILDHQGANWGLFYWLAGSASK